MLSYTTVYFAAVGIIALLMIILIFHEIGKRAGVKMERDRLMSYTSKLVDDKQELEAEVNQLSKEIIKLRNKDVPRETSSYNQSFGDPEVKMWLDQQFLEGDHK